MKKSVKDLNFLGEASYMQAVYENRQHDLYCRDSKYNSKVLSYHCHLHYQIEVAVIFEGHTHLTVDSTEYDVFGGDAFVVFPNQIHYFKTIERENCILLKINPDIIPELQSYFTTSLPKSNVIVGAANDAEIKDLVEKISQTYYGDEPFKDTILQGYLLAFFSKLLQKIELMDVQFGDYHALGMIMNYCNSNSDKDLSLSVLEKELHLNRYYISHIMSKKLHIGFNDYVNSLRITNACKHLAKSEYTITQIGNLVGFNALRTFNRAFYKQMGMTPSEYRKSKKNNAKPIRQEMSFEGEKI